MLKNIACEAADNSSKDPRPAIVAEYWGRDRNYKGPAGFNDRLTIARVLLRDDPPAFQKIMVRIDKLALGNRPKFASGSYRPTIDYGDATSTRRPM